MRPNRWGARLRALLARGRVEQELSEELDFHLEMQARKHRDAGMNAAEAAALARREFGNVEVVKEDARDVRGVRVLEDAGRDIRYALRSFARAPGFAFALVLTIGLGVGVSSSAFTVFDAYLLRPFDVRDPASLYSMNWMDRSGHYHDFSRADFDALKASTQTISDVLGFRTLSARLSASAATGDAVSETYFQALGVRPALGRTFAPSDAALPVVVLSYSAWLTRFAGDSSLVGRRVLLRGIQFQVIGVAQPGFSGLFKKPRDFWVPLDAFANASSPLELRTLSQSDVSVIARLAPGVSAGRGKAAVASVLRATTVNRPDSGRVERVFLESRASPVTPSLKSYAAFTPLLVSFGMILLLACANVANMLLARGLERRRELGIRLALGAARRRLVQQLVTESIVLTLPAAALGFGLGWAIVDGGLRAVFSTVPADLAQFVRFVPLVPDWRVVAFAVLATMMSALLCGLVPSLRATRLSVVAATRGEFRDGPRAQNSHGALIVGQIAAASLLLITAGLLLRQAARLDRLDTGLRTSDVVSIESSPMMNRAQVLSTLRSSPLVDSIAASAALPLDMRFPTVGVGGDSATVDLAYNRVTASYFGVMGIAVVAGRSLTHRDEDAGSPVVVVSESAARLLWPHANPVGRAIRLGLPNGDADSVARFQNALVVGVARDVVVQSVEDGRDVPALYFPARLESAAFLLARVRGNPDAAKRALDAALDRAVPGGVDRIDRLETFVAGAIYPFRVAFAAALILGVLALTLTVVGVYGVVAYAVGQRTREIGVRIALGATTRDVLALVMRRSIRQAALGTGIGWLFALAVARIIAANVPGVPIFDVVAVAGGSACVMAACCLAALIPSRQASNVDPMTALRHD